jgi:hypothetical protein
MWIFAKNKFVKNTHICEKIMQICVKSGKSCLVELGHGRPASPTNGLWLLSGGAAAFAFHLQVFQKYSDKNVKKINGFFFLFSYGTGPGDLESRELNYKNYKKASCDQVTTTHFSSKFYVPSSQRFPITLFN